MGAIAAGLSEKGGPPISDKKFCQWRPQKQRPLRFQI